MKKKPTAPVPPAPEPPADELVERHYSYGCRRLESRIDDVQREALKIAKRLHELALDIEQKVCRIEYRANPENVNQEWLAENGPSELALVRRQATAELGHEITHTVTWGVANLNLDTITRYAFDLTVAIGEQQALQTVLVGRSLDALAAGLQPEMGEVR